MLAAVAVTAHAQSNFPTKPIRIIVPSSPGGGLDFVSRAVGQQLTAAWGQSVVVDNRAGAGGTLGPELVARAAPDGYTLLIVSATFAVNPSAFDKLPYDTLKDFAPVALVGATPNALAVHPSLPAKNLREFIEYAKANPGRITYGSAGNGSFSHITSELLAMPRPAASGGSQPASASGTQARL